MTHRNRPATRRAARAPHLGAYMDALSTAQVDHWAAAWPLRQRRGAKPAAAADSAAVAHWAR